MAAEDPTPSEHERLIVRSLHRAAMTERAPAQLRERIEAERSRASTGAGAGLPVLGSLRPLGSLGVRVWSGAAAVVVAAAVAAVLLLTGGTTPGTPSIASAAALATKGATAPAPRADPTARYQLSASVGGLHFPNWAAQHNGWRVVGSRMDRLGNRNVKTVYYEKRGERVAYSIISTPKIRSGAPVTLAARGRTTFVWTEMGHTCLLSGAGVSVAMLRQLAATTVPH